MPGGQIPPENTTTSGCSNSDGAYLDNTLFDASPDCVLGADNLTLNTIGAKIPQGARGRAPEQASSQISFDVEVIAVATGDPEQDNQQPGLEAKYLRIGFSTPGANFNMGSQMSKDGPANSWGYGGDGKVYNQQKSKPFELGGFGVGDIISAHLVDGKIKYAVNDGDVKEAFQVKGKDLNAMLHPTVAGKHVVVRVRLKPAPLWPEVALRFALGREDPVLAIEALNSDIDDFTDLESNLPNVLRALEQFTEPSACVVAAAGLLRRYARSGNEQQTALVHLGAVTVLRCAMEKQRQHPEVLSAIMYALWNIAVNNEEGQVALCEQGIPALIKNAMYLHSGSRELQTCAMTGLMPWVLKQVPASASRITSPPRPPKPPEPIEAAEAEAASQPSQSSDQNSDRQSKGMRGKNE